MRAAIAGGGRARVVLLFACVVACRGSATTERDAAPAPASASASSARATPDPPDATPDPPDATPPPVDSGVAGTTLLGDWERVTEPYKGMVIRIAASHDVLEGTVLTPSRLASTPALACQASLWKAGEHYLKVQEMRASARGSIVVRDWGFTGGVCRHADAKGRVEARLEEGELVLDVTRGGAGPPVAQRWRRAP